MGVSVFVFVGVSVFVFSLSFSLSLSLFFLCVTTFFGDHKFLTSWILFFLCSRSWFKFARARVCRASVLQHEGRFQNFKDNLKYIEERMKVQQGDAYDDEEPKAEIHGDQQGGDYKEEPEAETHGDQKADTPGDQQGGRL